MTSYYSLTSIVGLLLIQAVIAIPHAWSRSSDSEVSKFGFVNVSVSTLWKDQSKPRAVDAPALSSPVQVQEWLDSMTVDQFKDLSANSRTETQVLYGSRVIITETQGDWYKIAIPDQPVSTTKPQIGYPGWVPSSHVSVDDDYYGTLQQTLPFAQVTRPKIAPLFRDAQLSDKIMDIAFNTRLPLITQLSNATQVAIPGGIAYLNRADVATCKHSSDIPSPTGQDIVETGRLFTGLPYLWGGTSGFAFDCSGFTYTVYNSHGIVIPRDSGPQAQSTLGIKVEVLHLKAGDLLFYAHNTTSASTIYHVAMYAGNGTMLEAYSSGVPLRLTAARLETDYWGAKRFIGS
ncbi:unnamed protein product [Clonostachys byssicola]|uniref:NlpC/P60 domain-containing protein n=1 Tax=Clonostachys byssicola TaxID=160290 RepID=A0A9N9UR72_9HYPO|nr:unnamed protein product [Clonostachys byssicola]